MGDLGQKTTNTTSTSSPPPQVLQNYQDAYTRAQGAAGAPFSPYPGQQTASLTPAQYAAFNTIDTSQGVQAPFLSNASSYANALGSLGKGLTNPYASQIEGASFLNPASLNEFGYNASRANYAGIGNAIYQLGQVQGPNAGSINANTQAYMNPFLGDVVKATQANINENNAEQQQQVVGNAISSGAFGGDRQAVAQSELARQQGLASEQTISNLLNTGFQQAQQEATGVGEYNSSLQEQLRQAALQGQLSAGQIGLGANQIAAGLAQNNANLGLMGASELGQLGLGYSQQQAQNLGNAAQLEGSLGSQALQGALTGASAQMQSGAVQQAQNQAIINAAMNQYYMGQQYPFQTSSFLANIAEGLGSQQGGTTNAQVPSGNLFSQLGGLGLAGLGLSSFLSDERAKENATPIGETFDQQPIYRFNYKGDPRSQIGLMAQDVERRNPGAVHEINGMKGVDYWDATEESARRGHFGFGGAPMGAAPSGGSWGGGFGGAGGWGNSGNAFTNSGPPPQMGQAGQNWFNQWGGQGNFPGLGGNWQQWLNSFGGNWGGQGSTGTPSPLWDGVSNYSGQPGTYQSGSPNPSPLWDGVSNYSGQPGTYQSGQRPSSPSPMPSSAPAGTPSASSIMGLLSQAQGLGANPSVSGLSGLLSQASRAPAGVAPAPATPSVSGLSSMMNQAGAGGFGASGLNNMLSQASMGAPAGGAMQTSPSVGTLTGMLGRRQGGRVGFAAGGGDGSDSSDEGGDSSSNIGGGNDRSAMEGDPGPGDQVGGGGVGADHSNDAIPGQMWGRNTLYSEPNLVGDPATQNYPTGMAPLTGEVAGALPYKTYIQNNTFRPAPNPFGNDMQPPQTNDNISTVPNNADPMANVYSVLYGGRNLTGLGAFPNFTPSAAMSSLQSAMPYNGAVHLGGWAGSQGPLANAIGPMRRGGRIGFDDGGSSGDGGDNSGNSGSDNSGTDNSAPSGDPRGGETPGGYSGTTESSPPGGGDAIGNAISAAAGDTSNSGPSLKGPTVIGPATSGTSFSNDQGFASPMNTGDYSQSAANNGYFGMVNNGLMGNPAIVNGQQAGVIGRMQGLMPGTPPSGISAMLGNLNTESAAAPLSLNANAVNQWGATGLAQDLGPRRAGLLGSLGLPGNSSQASLGMDPNLRGYDPNSGLLSGTMNAQLGYDVSDLSHYPQALAALNSNSLSLPQKTSIFGNVYEGPGKDAQGNPLGFSTRVADAQGWNNLQNALGSMPAASVTNVGSGPFNFGSLSDFGQAPDATAVAPAVQATLQPIANRLSWTAVPPPSAITKVLNQAPASSAPDGVGGAVTPDTTQYSMLNGGPFTGQNLPAVSPGLGGIVPPTAAPAAQSLMPGMSQIPGSTSIMQPGLVAGTYPGLGYNQKAQMVNVAPSTVAPDSLNSSLFGSEPLAMAAPSIGQTQAPPNSSLIGQGIGGINPPGAGWSISDTGTTGPAQSTIAPASLGAAQPPAGKISPAQKLVNGIGGIGTSVGNFFGGLGQPAQQPDFAGDTAYTNAQGNQASPTPAALATAMNFLSSHGGNYNPLTRGSNGGPTSSGSPLYNNPPQVVAPAAPAAPAAPLAPAPAPFTPPQLVNFGVGKPAVSAADAVAMYEAANGLYRGGRIVRDDAHGMLSAGRFGPIHPSPNDPDMHDLPQGVRVGRDLGGALPYKQSPTMPYGTFGSDAHSPFAGVSGIPVGNVNLPRPPAANTGPDPMQQYMQAQQLNNMLAQYSRGTAAIGGRIGYARGGFATDGSVDDGGSADQNAPPTDLGGGAGGDQSAPQAAAPAGTPPLPTLRTLSPQDKALALMSAGFGMMASRSPFALQGIGQGAEQGVNTLMTTLAQERQGAATQSEINYRAGLLSNDAKRLQQEGGLRSAQEAEARARALEASIYKGPYGPQMITPNGLGPIMTPNSNQVSAQQAAAATAPPGQPTDEFSAPTGNQYQVPLPANLPQSTALYSDTGKANAEETAKAVLGPSIQAAESGAKVKGLLGQLYHDYAAVPENGWLQAGALSAERLKLANTVTTLAGQIGMPVDQKTLMQIGSEQAIGKIINQLGMAVSKGLGREPGYMQDKILAAQPGMENTPYGRKLVMAGLMVDAQQGQDWGGFVNRYGNAPGRFGDLTGVQPAFNQQMPADRYVHEAQVLARMPQTAVETLRANPQTAAQFDRKYGIPGLSRYFLQ